MDVYLIQSIASPSKRYVGLTTDLDRRLKEHNDGCSKSTKENKPWRLVTYLKFDDDRKAERFEACLKQGSGYAFAKRHFW